LNQPRASRPQKRQQSAPGAREQILLAAQELFAKNGFHATSIRQIATSTGLNSQLIYYYFGDKSRLHRAVFERAATEIHARAKAAVDSDGSARVRLERFILEWTQDVLSKATLIRALFRAAQEGDKELAALVRERSSRNARLVQSLLDEGIRYGDFRKDLDSRFASASLAGMVFFLATSGPVVMSANAISSDEGLVNRLARHTADLFMQGIAADPVKRARRSR